MKMRQRRHQHESAKRYAVALHKFAKVFIDAITERNNRPGFMRQYLSRVQGGACEATT